MNGFLIACSIGAVSLSQDASLQPAQRSPLSPFFQQCHTLLESSYRVVSSSLVGRVSYGLWSSVAYQLVDLFFQLPYLNHVEKINNDILSQCEQIRIATIKTTPGKIKVLRVILGEIKQRDFNLSEDLKGLREVCTYLSEAKKCLEEGIEDESQMSTSAADIILYLKGKTDLISSYDHTANEIKKWHKEDRRKASGMLRPRSENKNLESTSELPIDRLIRTTQEKCSNIELGLKTSQIKATQLDGEIQRLTDKESLIADQKTAWLSFFGVR
jgi:hypothetical protein